MRMILALAVTATTAVATPALAQNVIVTGEPGYVVGPAETYDGWTYGRAPAYEPPYAAREVYDYDRDRAYPPAPDYSYRWGPPPEGYVNEYGAPAPNVVIVRRAEPVELYRPPSNLTPQTVRGGYRNYDDEEDGQE